MTLIPPAGWLFTRGPQSVRLVREENLKGCQLFVYGARNQDRDAGVCKRDRMHETTGRIEQALLGEGYQLAQLSSDRRGEHRRGADHRRMAR